MFSMLGKKSADNILNIFLTFTRKQYFTFNANYLLLVSWKQGLTFHANCLHRKKCQILFSGENKNVINLLSASFAHRVVKVKQTWYTWSISAVCFLQDRQLLWLPVCFPVIWNNSLRLDCLMLWLIWVCDIYIYDKVFCLLAKTVTIVVSIWSMWHFASKQVHLLVTGDMVLYFLGKRWCKCGKSD